MWDIQLPASGVHPKGCGCRVFDLEGRGFQVILGEVARLSPLAGEDGRHLAMHLAVVLLLHVVIHERMVAVCIGLQLQNGRSIIEVLENVPLLATPSTSSQCPELRFSGKSKIQSACCRPAQRLKVLGPVLQDLHTHHKPCNAPEMLHAVRPLPPERQRSYSGEASLRKAQTGGHHRLSCCSDWRGA